MGFFDFGRKKTQEYEPEEYEEPRRVLTRAPRRDVSPPYQEAQHFYSRQHAQTLDRAPSSQRSRYTQPPAPPQYVEPDIPQKWVAVYSHYRGRLTQTCICVIKKPTEREALRVLSDQIRQAGYNSPKILSIEPIQEGFVLQPVGSFIPVLEDL